MASLLVHSPSVRFSLPSAAHLLTFNVRCVVRLHALRVRSRSHNAKDILADCTPFRLHHTKLPAYIREMKKYHLAHHYKNFELGFGVTSKIWDYVFNTVLPM